MDRHYVSEFTAFINRYLEEHPEVEKDQHRGWRIWWDKQLDLKALEDAEKDNVPDDGYGYYASAWHKHPPPDGGGESH